MSNEERKDWGTECRFYKDMPNIKEYKENGYVSLALYERHIFKYKQHTLCKMCKTWFKEECVHTDYKWTVKNTPLYRDLAGVVLEYMNTCKVCGIPTDYDKHKYYALYCKVLSCERELKYDDLNDRDLPTHNAHKFNEQQYYEHLLNHPIPFCYPESFCAQCHDVFERERYYMMIDAHNYIHFDVFKDEPPAEAFWFPYGYQDVNQE